MKERERIVVSAVLSLLLIGWLGFLVHRSPRFPGSTAGAAFGVAAALIMLVPLAYPIVKRVPYLRRLVTAHISLPTLLTTHVYAGILGPVLAMIHTGHKFDSGLGITLTAALLLTVITGFIARYLLSYVNREIADKLILLQTARGDLDSAWGHLASAPAGLRGVPRAPHFVAALASVGLELATAGPGAEVARIAESVADLEYAVATHELIKRRYRLTLRLHIGLSMALYALLVVHIWSGIYFGLRWLP